MGPSPLGVSVSITNQLASAPYGIEPDTKVPKSAKSVGFISIGLSICFLSSSLAFSIYYARRPTNLGFGGFSSRDVEDVYPPKGARFDLPMQPSGPATLGSLQTGMAPFFRPPNDANGTRYWRDDCLLRGVPARQNCGARPRFNTASAHSMYSPRCRPGQRDEVLSSAAFLGLQYNANSMMIAFDAGICRPF